MNSGLENTIFRNGFIDSFSTFEIWSLLTTPSLEDAYPWSLETSIEIIYILLNYDHFKVAPSPSKTNDSFGQYEMISKALTLGVDMTFAISPNMDESKVAIRKTKNWFNYNNNRKKIVNKILELKSDDKNFIPCYNAIINKAWVENSIRLDGLFNKKFIPEISNLLNLSKKELKIVWEYSRKAKEIENILKNNRDNNELYSVLKESYLLALLMRGRYHEYISTSVNRQIFRHPIRNLALPDVKGKIKNIVNIESKNDTLVYYSWFILYSSFQQKKVVNRIKLWDENFSKAWIFYKRNKNLFIPYGDTNRAISDAIELLNKSDIKVYNKDIERGLSILELVIGEVVGFVFSTFTKIPGAGSITTEVTKTIHLKEKILESHSTRKLQKLASLTSGILKNTKYADYY